MSDARHLDEVSFWQRPWGCWHVLEEGKGYKVKKIIIEPEKYLSLQYHIHRAETWIVIQGEGKVILDEEELNVKVGDYFHVSKECVHQMFNTSKTENFVSIEIQVGDTTSEYDIIRL